MKDKYIFQDEFVIVLAGEAGQGIQTIEYFLTKIFKKAGYNIFSTKEYMSRVRGGSNSTELRISSKRVACYVEKIDMLFPLDSDAVLHLSSRISDETIIVGDKKLLNISTDLIDIPFIEKAKQLGGAIYTNTIACGFVLGLLEVDKGLIKNYMSEFFLKKGQDIIDKNNMAADVGYDLGVENRKTHNLEFRITKNESVRNEMAINGHQAVTFGAIAGGCDFISSYPMSPSTGVFTYLAQYSDEFGILTEQAEDEICAINMGIGSWYAGGRAMVSTAGGGFALMSEGLSLAGCIESPMVIHLAQRPAPATGLPTRTEQGDLQLALYSGHGEFPRVIFTPGNMEDAFLCSYKAFEIADKYQVPVFILTDQYLLDTHYNIPELPKVSLLEKSIVETTQGYKRYTITEKGLSPRGIPGLGKGLVCVDSDEHDEGGYITEDFNVRIAMVNKRLKRYELLEKEIIEPEFFGNSNYSKLIIGWGSTYHVIKEALNIKNSKDIGFLYFKQVYPLSRKILDYWQKAKEIVFIESNATGQFEKLIKREFALKADRNIHKYNGLAFSVEEILEKI